MAGEALPYSNLATGAGHCNVHQMMYLGSKWGKQSGVLSPQLEALQWQGQPSCLATGAVQCSTTPIRIYRGQGECGANIIPRPP